MSRITPVSAKKRKLEEAMRGKTGGKPKKRIKKQKAYHSSSSEDEEDQDVGFAPVNLGDSDEEASALLAKKQKKQKKEDTKTSKSKSTKRKAPTVTDAPSSSDEEDEGAEVTAESVTKPRGTKTTTKADSSEDSNTDSETDSGSSPDSNADESSITKPPKKKSKRNDPTAFSTSITKILSTKLPTSVRHDPVLSRSIEVTKSRQDASNDRLETKARAKLRAEKQAALQKGRTTDVLGIERGIAGEVAEKEKALRKIAQRGVIQLFNAFRAAHVKAEEARKEERKKGTVGMGERERKVNEVSKEGFLELIGGKKKQDGAAVSAGGK